MTERSAEYVAQDALKIWTRLPEEGIESIVPAEMVDVLSSTTAFAGEAAGTLSGAMMETPAAVLPDNAWGGMATLQDSWAMTAETVLDDVSLPSDGSDVFGDVPWLAEEWLPARTSAAPGSLDQLLSAARNVDHAVTAFTEHFTARQRVRSNSGLDEQVEELVNALQRGARVLASLRAS